VRFRSITRDPFGGGRMGGRERLKRQAERHKVRISIADGELSLKREKEGQKDNSLERACTAGFGRQQARGDFPEERLRERKGGRYSRKMFSVDFGKKGDPQLKSASSRLTPLAALNPKHHPPIDKLETGKPMNEQNSSPLPHARERALIPILHLYPRGRGPWCR